MHPRFDELGIFNGSPHGAPNHVLVNEYRPGQGIMPHEDGGAYYPLVATVSLGANIVFDLYEKEKEGCGHKEEEEKEEDNRTGGEGRRPRYRILQERRSLLVTTGRLYTDFLHGIANVMQDKELSPESICNWDLLRDKTSFERGWLDRQTRISLTYRDVLKVARVGNTLKFLNGK